MTGAGRALRAARLAQEHALRWVATLVFAGCALSFCVTLGDVSGSASIGQLFGALFAVVPAAWLWGRELHEVRIAREKAALAAQPRRFNADVDDDKATEAQPAQPAQPAPVRSTYYDDEDDD